MYNLEPFLLGFLEKMASIKEDMVQYPLKQPEVTIRKKHSDQVPTPEEDKKPKPACKEAMVEGNSSPQNYEMLAKQLMSFNKLPKGQAATANLATST